MDATFLSKTGLIATLATAAIAAGASGAAAQSMSSNSASFNAGYGRYSGQENQAVSAGTRDANGNRVIIDGVIQTGSDQSSFVRTDLGGASSTGSGAGFGGATAIGNNLSVITQGSWNTVIVDSTQINNGDVTANGPDGE
jgi:holdfast attachment protein HfaA